MITMTLIHTVAQRRIWRYLSWQWQVYKGYLSDEKKPYKFYFRQIHYSFYDCTLELRTKNDSYQVDLQT